MSDRIPISELQEITQITDDHCIPVDNGNTTNKITVENFNASANATAKSYAEAAAASATAASASAESASDTASEIENKINQASTLVSDAETYSQEASASASAASNSASAANASATAANNSAGAAANSVTSASDYATLARSWATGDTGARADEQYNNARYWAGEAARAAGGGVTSFNGRAGSVTAQAEDYSANQILYKTIPSQVQGEDPEKVFVDEVLADLEDKTQDNADDISSLQTDVAAIQAKETILAATLAVGATTLTFTDDSITDGSLIDIYATVDGVVPISKSVIATTLTLTFDAQEVAVPIKVRIEN